MPQPQPQPQSQEGTVIIQGNRPPAQPAPAIPAAPAAPLAPIAAEPHQAPLVRGDGTNHKQKFQSLLTERKEQMSEQVSKPRGYKAIAAQSRQNGNSGSPHKSILVTAAVIALVGFAAGVFVIVQHLAPMAPTLSTLNDRLAQVSDSKITAAGQFPAPSAAASEFLGKSTPSTTSKGSSPTLPINAEATNDPTAVVGSYFGFAKTLANSSANPGQRAPSFSTPRFMSSYSSPAMYGQLPPATGFHSAIRQPKRHTAKHPAKHTSKRTSNQRVLH